MKVEVTVTLKGNTGEKYNKGSIFSSPDIPRTLLEELSYNRGFVVVIPEVESVPTIEVPVEEIQESEAEVVLDTPIETVKEVAKKKPIVSKSKSRMPR